MAAKNPFLMFGSYIGLVVGLIGSYFSFAILFALAEQGRFTPIALSIPLIPAMIGFLAGWLIHLLVLRIIK